MTISPHRVVTLATSEACSNAIEHAYAGNPSGQVRLTARMHGPVWRSSWRTAAPGSPLRRGEGVRVTRMDVTPSAGSCAAGDSRSSSHGG
jgi:hypothetical protein